MAEGKPEVMQPSPEEQKVRDTLKRKQKQAVNEKKQERVDELIRLDSTRQRLENAFKQDYLRVKCKGVSLLVRGLTPNDISEIMELVALSDTTQEVEQMNQLMKRIAIKLAEITVDEELDEEFWLNSPLNALISMLFAAIQAIKDKAEQDANEIANFR